MDFELLDRNHVEIFTASNIEHKGEHIVYLIFRNFVTQQEIETWKDLLPIPDRANFDISYDFRDDGKYYLQVAWRWVEECDTGQVIEGDK